MARRNKEAPLTLADLPSSAKKIQKEKGKEEREKEKSSPEVAITSDFFFSLSSKPLPLPLPPTPGLPWSGCKSPSPSPGVSRWQDWEFTKKYPTLNSPGYPLPPVATGNSMDTPGESRSGNSPQDRPHI